MVNLGEIVLIAFLVEFTFLYGNNMKHISEWKIEYYNSYINVFTYI